MARREPAPEAISMRRASVWIVFVVAAIVSMEFIGVTTFGWLAPIIAIAPGRDPVAAAARRHQLGVLEA